MKKTTEDHSEDVRGMVKTTEELAREAGSGMLTVSTHLGYPWVLSDRELETFRNLAIQNERECAEPVGYFYQNERGFWHQAGDPIGFRAFTKLFTFPPAPQPCQSTVDALEDLDSMDDYARMQISVDAIGPRKVLEDYINQPCPDCFGLPHDVDLLNRENEEQAAEIAKLKEVIAKCYTLLPQRTPGGFVSFGKFYSEQENVFADPYNYMSKFKKKYLSDCEEALSAIKEIEK